MRLAGSLLYRLNSGLCGQASVAITTAFVSLTRTNTLQVYNIATSRINTGENCNFALQQVCNVQQLGHCLAKEHVRELNFVTTGRWS